MGEQVAARMIWGCSSAGRAPALQAGGHRFEPVHLHQSCGRQSRKQLGVERHKVPERKLKQETQEGAWETTSQTKKWAYSSAG